MILWPSGSGRLPDTEEVGGSIPPRITRTARPASGVAHRVGARGSLCAACGVAVARGPVKAEVMGFNSPRAALMEVPDLPVWHDTERHRARTSARCGCESRRRLSYQIVHYSAVEPSLAARTARSVVRVCSFCTISIRIVARCRCGSYDSISRNCARPLPPRLAVSSLVTR